MYNYLHTSIGFPWLRLIVSREKNPLIVYDTDHIYDADNIQRRKMNYEGNYILYFSFSTVIYKCAEISFLFIFIFYHIYILIIYISYIYTFFFFFIVGRFEEYKRINNVKNIMPDVPSSDEEDSDDELFDFVQYP